MDANLLNLALQDPTNAALSSADLSAKLQSDLRTLNPIPLATLVPWMNDNGLVSRLRRTVASPTLAAIITAGGKPVLDTLDSISDALDYMYSANNVSFDTTDPDRATKTYGLLQLMQGAIAQDSTLGMTSDQATTFLSFGGGLRFGPGSVSADQIDTARAALAFEASKSTQRNEAASVWNTFIAQLDSATSVDQLPGAVTLPGAS